ncbi:MAG: D-alanyl-lipoteichoic acid biosynthesis protein DltD [Eubacteriales bacterium]|nr:D-alanyl-lipoteichoic acid biosynthesis protein DltD [Eubacteriales bacterium]
MKKLYSFLIGAALAVVTFVIYLQWTDHRIAGRGDNNSIRYNTTVDKFASHDVIVDNMGKDTLLVLGSSEFQVGKSMKQHPQNMLDFKDMNLMMVGAGYYQSLWHAIALGSVGESIQNGKVVLFVSPQWFKTEGANPDAFLSRYSADHLLHFLQNEKIDKATKQGVIDRVKELVKGNPVIAKEISGYEAVYLKGENAFLRDTYYAWHTGLTAYKAKYRFYMKNKWSKKDNHDSYVAPAWEELRELAIRDGEQAVTTNPFYVNDGYYNKRLKSDIKKLKGYQKDYNYDESPEYGDLELFLQVAESMDLKVMFVGIPFNHFWTEYTELPVQTQQNYFARLAAVAEAHDVHYLDLQAHTKEPYWFRDTVHIGWKGWLDINEELVKFKNEEY